MKTTIGRPSGTYTLQTLGKGLMIRKRVGRRWRAMYALRPVEAGWVYSGLRPRTAPSAPCATVADIFERLT